MKKMWVAVMMVCLAGFALSGCGPQFEALTLSGDNADASNSWSMGEDSAGPERAVDGNEETDWAGAGVGAYSVDTDPAAEYWWSIDLGEEQPVSRIEMVINRIIIAGSGDTATRAGGKEYHVESSANGTAWTAITGAAGTLKQTQTAVLAQFTKVKTQYIRIVFDSCYAHVPVINEIKIYKSKGII